MANTTKTLDTMKHLKNIIENIIFDKQLREKMGPIFFPIMKDQLIQIIKEINDIQFKVEMLHFCSQFPGLLFTQEEILNSLNTHDQTLKNISDVLPYHYRHNPAQTPQITSTLPDPPKTRSTPLTK